MFKADWGATSKADNLKIDEIVTMSDTYEEAELECLKKLIEIVKRKKI